MSGRSRACSDVTRAQPPAAAGALCLLLPWRPSFLLGLVSVFLADDYRRVLVTGAQGPVVRVIGEDDAADAELVDQVCCTVRAGHLAGTGVRAAQFADAAGEQDGDGGQVRQDLVLAHVGVRWSSRFWAGGAGVAVAAPVGGLAVGPR